MNTDGNMENVFFELVSGLINIASICETQQIINHFQSLFICINKYNYTTTNGYQYFYTDE